MQHPGAGGDKHPQKGYFGGDKELCDLVEPPSSQAERPHLGAEPPLLQGQQRQKRAQL